jgi:methyl-accepting chemotaxis protein
VGHVEVVQDVTAAQRVAAYQQQEIERLAGNLCQLAEGDIDLDLAVAEGDEHTAALQANFEMINMSLERVQMSVATMMGEINAITRAILHGRLDTRADAGNLTGGFRQIAEGVNQALGAIVKNLEAVPTPIQFIDTEYRLQYINAAGARLLGRSKAELLSGRTCKEMWRTTKCETGECPCAVSMRDDATHECTNDLTIGGQRMDISCAAAPLHDSDGKVVGSFEFVTDQSAVVAAVRRAEKIVAFSDRESGRVAAGIEQLAGGDFSAQLDVGEADADTAGARAALARILAAVHALKSAVAAMAEDVVQLSQAAVAGELSTRADEARHRGEFQRIVAGLNATLDAAINPVTEAAAVLEKVAARDLTARVEGRYNGDHARIKTALNQAASNLDEGLQNVAAASQQVASAAGQISTQSQSLAQGSSEQASSLEEISASLAEMESMTRQNSDNAHRARQMADAALTDAARGRQSMDKLSSAIEKIKASSDATAKIVKTIDEIAFQTNLLALNAAVEAARAGDAGKGFAVVAEEVRNLAMRSAESAKNTAQLIEEAVRNAESGVQVETEVQKSLAEINDHARRVSEVMAEIAAASEQQTTGIAQINSAIGQMNELTQSSAAGAEESASVAEELSGQAQEMQALVGGFRLSGRSSAATAQPAAFAPPPPSVNPRPQGTRATARQAAPVPPRPASAKGSARELIPLDDDDMDKLSSF